MYAIRSYYVQERAARSSPARPLSRLRSAADGENPLLQPAILVAELERAAEIPVRVFGPAHAVELLAALEPRLRPFRNNFV